MSFVHSGYRHDLQVYPPKIAGHLRAVVWAAIAAGSLILAQVFS